MKGSIATEIESRQSWSDKERERDRPRDSVVQFPDGYDSEKSDDEDVSMITNKQITGIVRPNPILHPPSPLHFLFMLLMSSIS